MFSNYFKTALRNLLKNKGFSIINILGLAIGLATCLLILVYVADELSYDRYNKNAGRIYRLDNEIRFGDNHLDLAVGPAQAGPTIRKDYPEVEQTTRFRNYGGFLVRKGSQNIHEDAVIYADSTLFDLFTLPMIAGDPHTALTAPHTMVISEKMAKKYFNGAGAALGQHLLINDSTSYKITGIIRDMPTQSHFRYDFFVDLAESDESRDDNWLSSNFNTYILLRPGADPSALQAKLNTGMVSRYIAPLLKAAIHIDWAEFEKSGGYDRFSLMPLTSIHLHSNKIAEQSANGNVQYVYIFSAIAIFILIIACVNFMNLSTARSSNRAREVGVRKVLGSLRPQLILQFITESTLISAISMILALLMAWALLPFFNQLAAKEMSIGLLTRPWLIPSLLALIVIVGLLAGSYPAFFLSAFRPIAVLKGTTSTGFKNSWLRNTLVVFQFSISIFLIVGTAVVYGQLRYIRTRPVGFDRDHMLVIKNGWPLGNQVNAFRDDVLRIPGVLGATVSDFLPTSGNRNSTTYFATSTMDPKTGINMQIWPIDENYIPLLGIKMALGRNFSKDFLTDSNAMVINETTARMLGPGNPLQKNLYTFDNPHTRMLRVCHVIGVVKDFNFSSLREVVTPLCFKLQHDQGSITFRVNAQNTDQLISAVEARWKAFAPSQPFSYSFMDDDFEAIYRAEQRTGKISLSFSMLAIFIACLGLFGLAAYAAEQRNKEIGIRKVLGATASNIVALLSANFLKLVLIAALISYPFAWWAMHGWLQGFAYRIHIGWPVFALAGLMAAAIALVTVSFQAFKAALTNPVKSLRTE